MQLIDGWMGTNKMLDASLSFQKCGMIRPPSCIERGIRGKWVVM
jgi:hypothetical protein